MTIKPMLFTPLRSQEDFITLCNDDAWAAQPKLNGHRKLVADRVYGRDGQPADMPRDILAALATCSPFVLDGELLPNGTYYVFDTVNSSPFSTRLQLLASLDFSAQSIVRVVPTWTTAVDKLTNAMKIHKSGGEGMVFRRLDSLYVEGRCPTAYKVKFTRTVDVLITEMGREGKANLVMSLYNDNNLVEVGTVSALTGDGPKVRVGDVVEVTYLRVGPNGLLEQPVKPMLRTDKAPEECTWDQLK